MQLTVALHLDFEALCKSGYFAVLVRFTYSSYGLFASVCLTNSSTLWFIFPQFLTFWSSSFDIEAFWSSSFDVEGKASRFLCIKDEKPYHCSAVYAAALHSISLPFRMEPLGPTADLSYASGAVDVNGLIQMLAGQARQNMVAILDVSMPAPPMTGTYPSSFSSQALILAMSLLNC